MKHKKFLLGILGLLLISLAAVINFLQDERDSSLVVVNEPSATNGREASETPQRRRPEAKPQVSLSSRDTREDGAGSPAPDVAEGPIERSLELHQRDNKVVNQTGKVTDVQGNPIAGASVSVTGEKTQLFKETPQFRQAITDAEGNFEIPLLLVEIDDVLRMEGGGPGIWTVSADGYLTEELHHRFNASGSIRKSFVLYKLGSVSGFVVDAITRERIADACVAAQMVQPKHEAGKPKPFQVPAEIMTTTSGPDGAYTFESVREGTWALTALMDQSAAKEAIERRENQTFQTTTILPGTEAKLDLPLVRLRELIFRVSNNDVKKVRLTLTGPNGVNQRYEGGSLVYTSATSLPIILEPDQTGLYRYAAIADSAAEASLSATGKRSILCKLNGYPNNPIDLGTLTFFDEVQLLVHVVDPAGKPVERAWVSLDLWSIETGSSSYSGMVRGGYLGGKPNSTSTNREGLARISSLKEQIDYTIAAQPPDSEAFLTSASVDFRWDGTGQPEVTIELGAGARIEGFVDTTQLPEGPEFAPKTATAIYLSDMSPPYNTDGSLNNNQKRTGISPGRRVPADGSIDIGQLKPGPTMVMVTLANDRVLRSNVVMTLAGKVSTVEFLYPKGGSITGRVTYADGRLFAGGQVKLLSRSGLGDDGGSKLITLTDGTGSYLFDDVPPGRYFVAPMNEVAWRKGTRVQPLVRTWPNHEVVVRIQEHVTKDLVIEAPQMANISLRLLLNGKNYYESAMVTDNNLPGYAIADKDGIFHFENLAIYDLDQVGIQLTEKTEERGKVPSFTKVVISPKMQDAKGLVDLAFDASPVTVVVACPTDISPRNIRVSILKPYSESHSFTYISSCDADGSMKLNCLPHGEYRLKVSCPNRADWNTTFEHNGESRISAKVGGSGGSLTLIVDGAEGSPAGDAKLPTSLVGLLRGQDNPSAFTHAISFASSKGSTSTTEMIAPGRCMLLVRWGNGYESTLEEVEIEEGKTTTLHIQSQTAATGTFTISGLDDLEPHELDRMKIQLISPWNEVNHRAQYWKLSGGSLTYDQTLTYRGTWILRVTLPGYKNAEISHDVTMGQPFNFDVMMEKE